MTYAPFTEDMLSDPNGVLILCKSLEDAEELDRIVMDYGYNAHIAYRYANYKLDHQDRDFCFRFRITPDKFGKHFGHSDLGFYNEEPDYDDYIRSVFVQQESETEIDEVRFDEILRG